MAKIANVAHDLAVIAAEEAALAEAREMAAEENIVELLDRRGQYEELRKAAETLLANINLSNAKFDAATVEDRELTLEDTEALLANYDFLDVTFSGALPAVLADYQALKANIEAANDAGELQQVCGCPNCSGYDALAA